MSMQRSLKPVEQRVGGKVLVEGTWYWDFSSNDYLGLAQHPDVRQAMQQVLAKDEYPLGSTGSRLLSGDYTSYHELESELADFFHQPSALLFNSGYHVNCGLFSALLDRHDVVFADKWIHASLLDGIRLSGATLIRYPHNDMDALAALLEKRRSSYKKACVVSESVFSMDGDRAPLDTLVALKQQYDAMLVIDEAHALGVYGPEGNGLVLREGLSDQVDICVAAFGKAMGVYGGCMATSESIKQQCIQSARSLLFSTSLPPVIVAGLTQALRVMKDQHDVRSRLADLSDYFRDQLGAQGVTLLGTSHIVPVIVGSAESACRLSEALKHKGIWALPIRPPTVPDGQSRLRFVITAHHNREVLDEVLSVVSEGWS